MDAVSSAAAVISLAIQLTGTVQSVRQFLNNVENAPKELSAITDLLGLLHQSLSHVEALVRSQHAHGITSHTPVTSALQCCQNKVKTLENFIATLKASLISRHRLRKAWGSIKVVSRKGDIQMLQMQLRDAVLALQMAISTSTAEIQHVHPGL